MSIRQSSKQRRFILVMAVLPTLLDSTAKATVSFDMLTIGNPGNAGDTLVNSDGTSGHGSVNYNFAIASKSVSNSQYVEFLNKVDPSGSNSLRLWETRMSTWPVHPTNGSGGISYQGGIDLNTSAPTGSKYSVQAGKTNYPAMFVNWASSIRFVNWLSNGQGSSGTESGVYTAPPLGPTAWAPVSQPTRASGAKYFLPTEDEYYKAAYYDPTLNGGAGGYYQWGARSNTAPTAGAPGSGTNVANKRNPDGTYWQTGLPFNRDYGNYIVDVGSYPNTKSYYGMLDAEGEVYNWTETFKYIGSNLFPIYKGGSYYYDELHSGASQRLIYSYANVDSYSWFGFRVAGLPIEGIWNVNLNGIWSASGNWSGVLPDGTGSSATFGSIISAAKTITLDSSRTVGTLAFNNSNKYTISGSGTLTIDSSGTGLINVINGSHEINVPVSVLKDTSINISNSLNTLKLTNLQPTTRAITKSGTGTLEVNTIRTTDSLSVTGGNLSITANGGPGSVVSVGALSISAGAKIDLHDNDLISNYGAGPSTYSTIVNQVKSGLTLLGGAGTDGIGSTEADAQTIGGTVLAVVDDGDPNIGGGITSLSGYIIPNPATSVLVKYTWFGDANLDGIIDGSDYALTDTGFTSGGLLGGWVFGDYDYNGLVEGGDYALQDTGFIAQTGTLPEPGMLSLIGVSAVGLMRRRKN